MSRAAVEEAIARAREAVAHYPQGSRERAVVEMTLATIEVANAVEDGADRGGARE